MPLYFLAAFVQCGPVCHPALKPGPTTWSINDSIGAEMVDIDGSQSRAAS